MKTLYLDLGMGAAGDMLTAALLELTDNPDAFLETLNGIGIPGVRFEKEASVKCGVTGTRISVTVNGEEEGEELRHDHEHHGHHHEHGGHGDPESIAHIVNGHMNISPKIRKDVLGVYDLLARAESEVHGVPVTEIHFHEVGAMDALADITAVCMLMDALAPDAVIASPVRVGSGQVKCAHGILPVPAPATARLLIGVPFGGGPVEGELCTPTGAALLKYFVSQFGDMPVMKVEKLGCGMGKKDFEAANCVRAMLGGTTDRSEGIIKLECNVDDMTAEEIGFAVEAIFGAGAREVFTVPVGMKKNRPGTLICAICDEESRESVVNAVFRHTSTLGIRQTAQERYVLDRRIGTFETSFGPVRRKKAAGYGVSRAKTEYDDIARAAREKGLSFREAKELIESELEE